MWELHSRRSECTSEEDVVGRKEQPLTGPQWHKVQPAAAALKYSPPFCTVKLRPLQNDVLENRLYETRPKHQAAEQQRANQMVPKFHAATASRCLERQLKHRVMLSLSGLPRCKSECDP